MLDGPRLTGAEKGLGGNHGKTVLFAQGSVPNSNVKSKTYGNIAFEQALGFVIVNSNTFAKRYKI